MTFEAPMVSPARHEDSFLLTPARVISENDSAAVVAVRIAKATIRENLLFLRALGDLAADYAPGSRFSEPPLRFVAEDGSFVAVAVRVSKMAVADSMPVIEALIEAAGTEADHHTAEPCGD